jgi:hypothetical protein
VTEKKPTKKELAFSELLELGIEEKPAKKFVNCLGDSALDLMKATPEQLKRIATEADMRVDAEREKLDDNEAYCKAKDTVKTLMSAFRDATKKDATTKKLCMLLLKKGD